MDTGQESLRRRALPLSAPLLGSVTAMTLGLVAPLGIVSVTPTDGHSAWLGAATIMAVSGARFGWIIASRQRRLFEMVTWLFVYVFLGAAPLVQMREGVDPDTTPNIVHGFDWEAVSLVLIGSFAIMLGSFAAKHLRPSSAPDKIRAVSHPRTTVLSYAAIAAGLYYLARIGPGAIFGSRNARSQAASQITGDSSTSAIVIAGVAMMLLVSVIAQAEMWRERRALGERKPLFLIAATTVLLFTCVNPISSPRYVFGTVILGVLAAFGLYSTLRKFRIVSIASVFGLVFLFPMAATFRSSLDSKVQFPNPLLSFLSGDYDSFAQINNTLLYVARSGITWGNQALGVVLFWVPRSAWSGKPVDTGILLANSRDYAFTNLSAPLWAEMFVNGGWALVLIGMFLFGFAVRYWDAISERQLSSTGVPAILGCTVPFYLMILLRGSLLQSMAYLSMILLCTWFVYRPAKAGLHREFLARDLTIRSGK